MFWFTHSLDPLLGGLKVVQDPSPKGFVLTDIHNRRHTI